MTKIGTGYIEVDADLGPFWKKIEAELKGVNSRFKSAGNNAGSALATGLARGMRDIDRESTKAGKSVEHAFGSGTIGKIAKSLENFRSSLISGSASIGGVRLALAIVVPSMIAFGGATFAAASSLAPLIGLAAAGANVFASLGQGLGVAALAFAGIGGALTEQLDKHNKVAAAAVNSASQQRSAARAIQNAQDGVTDALDRVSDSERDLLDAQKDSRKAQKELTAARTEARRAISDLHDALTDATLGEKRAALDLKEAQRDLAALGKTATRDELTRATQAVTFAFHDQTQAALSLLRAQQALDDLLKRAAGNANRQAQANAALARAQENLSRIEADANATYDERTAALALVADASKAVRDANDAATVSELDKAQALQDVTDAQDGVVRAQDAAVDSQKALQDLKTGPTDLQKADALLRVVEAQQRLAEAERDRARTAKDAADADKAGVEGSKEVRDARQAIADASRRVADAEEKLSDAHRGVVRAEQSLADAQLSAQEAMQKTGLAAANLNEKFDKLPPSAQAFVRELIKLKPQLDKVRETAAAGLLPGVSAGIQAAMANFGPFNRVVAVTAQSLGEAARKSGELVGSSAFGKDLEIIGTRNAKVIDTLGEALRHIISALRNVMVAAGPLTQWLADVINKWSLQAAVAAESGRETGKMAAFFERTKDVLQRLGSIIGHIIGGLGGLGKAGKETGDGIWASIDRAAKRFDEWANSKGGQKSLKEFFEKSTELAGELTDAFAGIAKGIAFFTLKLFPLNTALKLLGPYADEATVFFLSFKAAAFAAAAATKVHTAATVVHDVWTKRMTASAIRWRAQLLLATAATYAQRVAVLAAAAASKVMAAGQWLLNAALTANPIGLLVVGLAALVGGLIYAYKHSETFRKIVQAAFQGVKDAFGWVLHAAEDAFNWLKDNWPLVLSILTGPIGLAVLAIVKHWDDIKGVFTDGFNAVLGIIKGFGKALLDAGGWVIDQIVSGIKSAANAVASAVTWFKDLMVNGIHNIVEAFKSVGSWILNRIIDGFKAVTSLFESVGGWVRARISDFIHAEIEGLKVIGSWLLNRIVDGFKFVTDALSSVGGWLKNRFTDIIHGLGESFKDLGGFLVDKIVDGLKLGVKGIVGFVNLIIKAINAIPGLPDIKEIQFNAKSSAIEKKQFGGKIMSPMAIVGEQAPQWPEYVIPTNPRYRGRAMSLTRQMMGDLGLPGYKVGGIIGKAINVATGLVSSLPGVDSLPDWLHGTGTWLLKHVADAVTKAVKTIATSAGGGGGKVDSGVSGSIQGAISLARDMGLAITSTTGGDHVANSWHYKGRAADVAGSPGQMAAFFNAALARYGSHLLELFYDPLGAIKDGHRIGAIGGHSDHVHIALQRGGILPYAGAFQGGGIIGGPAGAAALATVHGGETIVPRGGELVGALREHTAELRALRQAGVSGVMASITDHVLQRGGDDSQRRQMTAGNPAVVAIYT